MGCALAAIEYAVMMVNRPDAAVMPGLDHHVQGDQRLGGQRNSHSGTPSRGLWDV